LATLAFLALWEITALRVASPLILPTPLSVGLEFIKLCGRPDFLLALASSAARALAAFGLSFVLGAVFGIGSALCPIFGSALKPFLGLIKSTPVLAIIVLLLIWFPQGVVPIISALLMAVPVVSAAFEGGMASINPEYLELARVFQISGSRKFGKIILPSLLPFAVTGASSALAIVWKVVIAGEVLSQPRRALGTGLVQAKVYLETSQALAWALAAVILATIMDIAFHFLKKGIAGERSAP
jgi:NitT/TauT family transport system permease protein